MSERRRGQFPDGLATPAEPLRPLADPAESYEASFDVATYWSSEDA